MRTGSPSLAHGMFMTQEGFFLSRCHVLTAQFVAVGGLEKAFSSVSHPSSKPLAKPETNIHTRSHESHAQTQVAEKLSFSHFPSLREKRSGSRGEPGLTWEQYFSARRRGGCMLLRCRARQEQQGHLSPYHQEGVPPEARPWGAGAMLTAAEGMAHSVLRKTSTVPEPPSRARFCHPHQLRRCHFLRASRWLGSHTDFPPTQTPCLHSLVAHLLFSVFPAHFRILICHPGARGPERKVTLLLCRAPHLRVPAGLAAASQRQPLRASRTCSAKRSFTDEERWQTSQLHEEGLEERSNLGDHQAGALMGNIVLWWTGQKKKKGMEIGQAHK